MTGWPTLVFSCSACLAHLIWRVCEMRGKWPYSCCFVGCCFQDLFKSTYSIIVQLPFSFFSKHFLQVFQPYDSFSQLQLGRIPVLFYWRSDFHMVNNLSIIVHSLPMCMLALLSVDEILLLKHGLLISETWHLMRVQYWLKCLSSVLFKFT